jgi:hypothetical protein
LAKYEDSRLSKAVLDAAQEITFVIKVQKQDEDLDSIVLKLKSLSGVVVLQDGNPDSPNLRIDLSAVEMNIAPCPYFMGLSIELGAGEHYEMQMQFNACLFDTVNVNQNVVQAGV